jgi:hypothetical protein
VNNAIVKFAKVLRRDEFIDETINGILQKKFELTKELDHNEIPFVHHFTNVAFGEPNYLYLTSIIEFEICQN